MHVMPCNTEDRVALNRGLPCTQVFFDEEKMRLECGGNLRIVPIWAYQASSLCLHYSKEMTLLENRMCRYHMPLWEIYVNA
jgi:hypothetical protein